MKYDEFRGNRENMMNFVDIMKMIDFSIKIVKIWNLALKS